MNVYQVDDDELLEQITSPRIEQKSIGWQSWLGGIFALNFGNLLQPLMKYLDMEITTTINITLLLIAFFVPVLFCFYINIRSSKKMKEVIHLEEYPKEKLWIRAHSSKNVFHVLFAYTLFLGSLALFSTLFIQTSNAYVLFGISLFWFITLLFHVLTVQVGNTKIRFKAN